MSNTTTATVETLTAEVRVLMVGSRQVTLSMYRQLDVIPLNVLEPFGRVRSGAKFNGEAIEVVGARKSDGSLCASWLSYSEWAFSTAKYKDPGGGVNEEIGAQDWERLAELPLIVLAGLR